MKIDPHFTQKKIKAFDWINIFTVNFNNKNMSKRAVFKKEMRQIFNLKLLIQKKNVIVIGFSFNGSLDVYKHFTVH